MKSFSSLVSLIWDQVGSRGKFLYSLSLSTTTTIIWVYVSNRFKMSVVLCCYIFVKTSTNFKSFRRICVHILSSKKRHKNVFFFLFVLRDTTRRETSFKKVWNWIHKIKNHKTIRGSSWYLDLKLLTQIETIAYWKW